MPRIPRGQLIGHAFHLLNRGNGRATVLRNDGDAGVVQRRHVDFWIDTGTSPFSHKWIFSVWHGTWWVSNDSIDMRWDMARH